MGPNCNPCKSPYKFRYLHPLFWERVLPAVYDDTLTYYELLCKLICKINEFVELANEYGEVIDNFEIIDQAIAELNERIDELNAMLPDIDDIPTDGSENLVTSNGVYDFVIALTALLRQIDVVPTDGSENLVTSNGVYDALAALELLINNLNNATTNVQNRGVDLTPTDGSTNLVDSNGIYDAIQSAISSAIGGYPDLGQAIINYLDFGDPIVLQYGTPYNATNGFTLGGKYVTAQYNSAQTIVALGGFLEFRLTSELTTGAMSPHIPITNLQLPNNAGHDVTYQSTGLTLNWSANVKRSCSLIHKTDGTFELLLNLPIYWAATGTDPQGNYYYDCCVFFAFPVFLARASQSNI